MAHPRPFRHLCSEADYRDSLSDHDFWHYVFSQYTVGPDSDDGWWGNDEHDHCLGVVVISDHASPCPLCGEWGACGYDHEGRPMIHAFYDDLEDNR